MSEHEPCGWAHVHTGVTLSKCVQTSALKEWDQNTTLALAAQQQQTFSNTPTSQGPPNKHKKHTKTKSDQNHKQIGLNMVSRNPQHPEKHNICVVDQNMEVTTNHISMQSNAKTRARHSRIKNALYPHTVNNVWSGLLYPSVLKTNQSIYHTFPPS